MKRLKILTIVQTNPQEFDANVNRAIAAGWYLANRYSQTARMENGAQYPAYIADLQRFVEITEGEDEVDER